MGLRHERVGFELLQRLLPILLPQVDARDHEDPDSFERAIGLDLLAQIEARQPGQKSVQDHDIGLLAAGHLQHFVRIAHGADRRNESFETPLQQSEVFSIVVDNQNRSFFGHCETCTTEGVRRGRTRACIAPVHRCRVGSPTTQLFYHRHAVEGKCDTISQVSTMT